MKFIEFINKEENKVLRQGQAFLVWISKYKGWKGNDPELFYCSDDRKSWGMINQKYGAYLTDLT